MPTKWVSAAVAVLACLWSAVPAGVRAATCPTPMDAITTDRPDVTNSSLVVPTGSLQAENGVNIVGQGHSQSLDATNTRLRLGAAECLEILFDVPTYFARLRGQSPSGFSGATPAIKRQLDFLPAGFTLSATAGLGLPTGDRPLGGNGYGPYLQFPWARDLPHGWGVSGMVTEFFHTREAARNAVTEATFVVSREMTPDVELFVEYVGEYPARARASHLINSGALYRVTPTQQIDFHTGGGVSDNAPDYFFGLGYSIRWDGLF